MERKTAVARCAECGEVLSEGDAAYSLLGETICPTCVKHSFIICGGESTRNFPTEDFPETELEKIYNIIQCKKTREGGDER